MPHQVKTLVGNVTLPSDDEGPPISVQAAQQTITLTDAQYAKIPPAAFASMSFYQELTPDQISNANAPYQGLYYSLTGTHSAYLQDLGATAGGSILVTAQGTHVAAMGALTSSAPAAVTSSQNATTIAVTPANASYTQADQTTIANLANALKISYNAAQVDIAALRTTLAAVQTDLATLRTLVNTELAALQITGGPQAAS
jgi:hypothetical protein